MGKAKKYKIYRWLIIISVIIIGVLALYFGIIRKNSKEETVSKVEEVAKDKAEESTTQELKEISNFDYAFLKLENGKENKIYSPLSIRYALNMLKDGATGNSKLQIAKVIGEPSETVKKYTSSENMSFANALFVRDTYKENVKSTYVDKLKTKYDAEVSYDDFASADNINNWISGKTFNLINNMLSEVKEDENFFLVNALGIDMDWENQFFKRISSVRYDHEEFSCRAEFALVSKKFGENNIDVSAMEIAASINNYDIISELGKENIIETVSEAFRTWAKGLNTEYGAGISMFKGDLSDANIEKKLNEYLYGGNLYNSEYYEEGSNKGYLAELNENYGEVFSSVDFSLYTDDEVKVFAKDLKEYNGTTLQYVGIMPTNKSLDSYVENVTESEINNIISNLKELKTEDFKQGVVTKITGYIPKFKFDYELNLKSDLSKLGVTDIFEQGKANLTEITDDSNICVGKALHKANIDFNQDGIKATAASIVGGWGAGSDFDYLYDVPVEEIDLTFDKPYMFVIRDKEDGTVWFTGTVYEPLLWENETEKN